MANGIQLAPLMTQIKVDIKGFNSQMQQAATAGVAKANEISKSLSNVAKVGEGLSKVGGSLTKYVSAPIGIAAGSAVKMAMDFEDSFAKVSTLLDSNKVDFNKYKQDLIKGSTESGIAVDKFNDSVYQSISAGVDQTKAIGFTTEAMKLSKAGFADSEETVNLLTTAINGYNLKTEDTTKISDILINTQNQGKTTIKELASSMGTVIPIASAANFNIAELSTAFSEMTKKGIDTAESGTYVKSMLSELTKTGSSADKALREVAGKGFAELKKEGVPTTEILNKMSQYAEKNGMTLKDMFGSVEGGSAAMIIASSNGKEFNDILATMDKSAGATADAVKKIDSTPAAKLKKEFNELKNKGIEMAEKLMPSIEKVVDGVGKVVDEFNGLSPEMQDFIVKAGGIAIALGPALKVMGSVTTGATGIVKTLSKLGKGGEVVGAVGETAAALGEGGGLLGAIEAVGTVIAPEIMVPLGLTAAAITGIAVAANKSAIPSVDLFAKRTVEKTQEIKDAWGNVHEQVYNSSEKISEGLQNAVQGFLATSDSMSADLEYNYSRQTVITDQYANEMNTKYQTLGDSLVQTVQQKKDTELEALRASLANQSQLTEEQKQAMIQKAAEKYDGVIASTQQGEETIKGIMNGAAQNHRALTQDEYNTINKIVADSLSNTVQQTAQSGEEEQAVRDRLEQYKKTQSEQTASQIIKDAEDTRVKSVDAANKQYEDSVAAFKNLREQGVITSDEQMNEMIGNAEKTKNDTVDNANNQKAQVLIKLLAMNKDMKDHINAVTGEVARGTQNMSSTWDNLKFATKYMDIVTRKYDVQMNANGSSLGVLGGGRPAIASPLFNGLSYVPTDGYMARLHKGERVLTADENKQYVSGGAGGTTVNNNFNGNYSFKDSKDIEYFMNQAALKLKGVR